ncbi:LacI family transcriptional regulator [Capsulimonas corticalis]|uniref:LacI family transcriptional regulator n=2 Tax=Capsulimonas corticalis TaxID=2219043 RepID=A0A402CVQ3_9BACT|nr:LacI family transcriptional regulator [Capsulimonas corticalis]
MREVAKVAGVSRTAVYHVVNNRPGEVSQDTRARILKAIRDIGYTPPPRAKANDERKIEIVGFVITASAATLTMHGYHQAVFHPVLRAAEAHGINITVFTGDMFGVDTSDKVRLYCDGRCDGMILTALRAESSLPHVLAERGSPFVIVGSANEYGYGYTVDVDNEHGVTTLVEYLLGLGHRRMAFRPGPDFVQPALARAATFFHLAEERGFEAVVIPGWERSCHTDDTLAWAKAILSLPAEKRPTAIVAWNDEAAVEIIRYAREIGIEIPKDISVVGFDDVMDYGALQPALTTYRQPLDVIGAEAVALLHRQFQSGFEPGDILVRGTLTERLSAGPPPSVLSNQLTGR